MNMKNNNTHYEDWMLLHMERHQLLLF